MVRKSRHHAFSASPFKTHVLAGTLCELLLFLTSTQAQLFYLALSIRWGSAKLFTHLPQVKFTDQTTPNCYRIHANLIAANVRRPPQLTSKLGKSFRIYSTNKCSDDHPSLSLLSPASLSLFSHSMSYSARQGRWKCALLERADDHVIRNSAPGVPASTA